MPRLFFVVVAGLGMAAGLVAVAVGAAPPPIDDGDRIAIAVHATVDRPFHGLSRVPARDFGRSFALAAVRQAPSPDPLVRPVEREAVQQALLAELLRQGYRPAAADEHPEVVISALYGRGYLHNPYSKDPLAGHAAPMGMPGVGGGGVPMVTINALSPELARRVEFGYLDKVRNADYEKLFISIAAYAHPEAAPPARGRKAAAPKPHLLWRTVISVDYPEAVDLNAVLGEMLAAGAGYFNRETRDGQAYHPVSLPAGSVRIGPLEVIE
jgi:hypothetical protein